VKIHFAKGETPKQKNALSGKSSWN
jgi:hypothetical protein